jgi:hypothetical protein
MPERSAQGNRPRAGGEFLERWERLTASMDAIRVTRSLREAVNALATLREIVGPGEARDVADAAILRVEELLKAEVDLDA